MDEKELIKRIKNSFKAKKSPAEILTGFQKRGYKLAYADKLITKAKRPKRIAIAFLVVLVIFFSITFSSYIIFFDQQKTQTANPLSGFTITDSVVTSSLQDKQLTYDQIEITPKFISYLLNEIAAWKLHKNPLNFEKPIINFKIGDENFYSEIENEIKTYKGLSQKADLQFDTNKVDLIKAISSNNPKAVLKKSFMNGRTQLEIFAGEAELFSKGYFKFYNFLK